MNAEQKQPAIFDKISNVFQELEKEDKFLSSYGWIAEDTRKDMYGAVIQQRVNEHLCDILECELEALNSWSLVKVIALAYYRKVKQLREECLKCEYPFFAGLMVVFICRKMKQFFEGEHETQLAEDYDKIREDYDKRCKNLLHACHQADERTTLHALTIDYHSKIASSSTPRPMMLLDLAARGKAKHFLSEKCCQDVVRERWMPGFRCSSLAFFLHFICPLFFLTHWVRFARSKLLDFNKKCSFKENKMKKKQEPVKYFYHKQRRRFINAWNFYTSPCAKYGWHLIFHILYVILFTYVLLTMNRRSLKIGIEYFYKEIALVFWQFSFLLEMIRGALEMGVKRYVSRRSTDTFQAVLSACMILSSLIAFVITNPLARSLVAPIADFLFYVSFVFASVRLLKVLSVDHFLGAVILMIKKTIYTLLSFMLVFVAFWFTYAVCVLSLSGYKQPLSSLPWHLFRNGAFEIFGEPADELKSGEVVNECEYSPFDFSSITDASVQCFFKQTMIPLVLFTYLMVASLLVVNLTTAFITTTYEDVQRNASVHWRYKMFIRTVEFEERSWIPAPFSIFYNIIYVPYLFFKSLYRRDINSYNVIKSDTKPTIGQISINRAQAFRGASNDEGSVLSVAHEFDHPSSAMSGVERGGASGGGARGGGRRYGKLRRPSQTPSISAGTSNFLRPYGLRRASAAASSLAGAGSDSSINKKAFKARTGTASHIAFIEEIEESENPEELVYDVEKGEEEQAELEKQEQEEDTIHFVRRQQIMRHLNRRRLKAVVEKQKKNIKIV